jgi:hypothetical protein
MLLMLLLFVLGIDWFSMIAGIKRKRVQKERTGRKKEEQEARWCEGGARKKKIKA